VRPVMFHDVIANIGTQINENVDTNVDFFHNPKKIRENRTNNVM
jgi:hypothetical protein